MAFILGSNGFIGSHMLGIEEPGVICMAGISDTTFGNTPAERGALHEANFQWPHQVFIDCLTQGQPFIYASSASVYGNGNGPLNEYARQKKKLDDFILSDPPELRWANWYGLRFFNVYGPGEDHKGKQASIVSRLLSGELKEVFAPETTRDFVHVSDCVSVARWLLQTLPPSGIYDVGTGVSRSIHDVVRLTGAKVTRVPMPEHLVGKYQFHTKADLTKLRAAGYTKPFLSLEEGIRSMRSFRQAA